MKRIFWALFLFGLSTPSWASCPSFPYSLTNGTTADATQVMSNLNNLLTCLNTLTISSYRNLLIGGDFTTNPWQRGTSFSSVANGAYTADRFFLGNVSTGSGAFNIARTADAPTVAQAGVQATQSLKFTVGTAATGTGAGSYAVIGQSIEAFNWGPLGFGQAGAQSVTASFWVKSSVTGTYSAAIWNYAASRSYPVNFSISTANTWQQVVVTIPGDTTGTWIAGTNAGAASLFIVLHAGSSFQSTNATWAAGADLGTSSNSNNLITTLGATFQVALVQLEPGTTATAFEALPEDVVLARSERYFQSTNSANDIYRENGLASGAGFYWRPFPVSMRVAPTMSLVSVTYQNASGAGFSNVTPFGTEINFSYTAPGNYVFMGWAANAEL